MPIYEYLCRACGRKSSFFTRFIGNAVEAVCTHCQSGDMRRAVSSFAYHKSLGAIHEQSGPPPGPGASQGDYYSDPRNIGRRVEQSFDKYGVDMPQSVRDTIDAAREGQAPEGLDI